MIFGKTLNLNSAKQKLFQQFFLKQDLVACRAISFLVIFVMLMLSILDFFRVNDITWVLVSRLIVCSLFATLCVLTYKISIKPITLQIILLFINTVFIFSLFTMDIKSSMPQFFLTNSIVIYMFITMTVSGLWFYHGAIINLCLMILFFIYLPLSKHHSFHTSQIVNISNAFIISILMGYVWERHKRTLFLQHSQMNKILSIFSHDMASPFNSLLGLLKLNEKRLISGAELALYSSDIKRTTSSNVLLLQSLVKWSKSQLEGFKPNIETINLNPLIKEVIELMSETAKQKNIELRYNPLELNCKGDADMIKLIIRNTLSNALKFSNPDSNIDINAKQTDDYSVIEIKDYGLGMTREEIDRLSGLQVVSKVGTSNEHGSGIGLYITREFVDLNKGLIQFQSQPGQGTTVTISFIKGELG